MIRYITMNSVKAYKALSVVANVDQGKMVKRLIKENKEYQEEIELTNEWMAKDDEGKRQHRHNMPLDEFIGTTMQARRSGKSFWKCNGDFDAKWIEEVEKHDQLLEDALEKNEEGFVDWRTWKL